MTKFGKLYRWVPSLYFMQGLPYAFVIFLSPIFYKTFNYTNTAIAFYTSLFSLPWLLKPFFAPILEPLVSKRFLTVITQFLFALMLFLFALSLYLHNIFYLTGGIFLAIGAISMLHDMNSDGLYIVSLNAQAQAHFIGIRSLFYQIGSLTCQGGLVFFTGLLVRHFAVKTAWQIAFCCLAALAVLFAIYHSHVLPFVKRNLEKKPSNIAGILSSYKDVFRELSSSKNLTVKILFIVIYNLSQAQLSKIVPLFLMDKPSQGGLGLSLEKVGLLYGTVGTSSMLLGILLSGFLLTKFSLKKYIIPVTLFMCIMDAGYLTLNPIYHPPIGWIGGVVMLNLFGYGLSNGGYMLYLIRYFSQGEYSMSLYACGTALMGLSTTLGGMLSGYLQTSLGYTNFFYWIVLINICIVAVTVYTQKTTLVGNKHEYAGI